MLKVEPFASKVLCCISVRVLSGYYMDFAHEIVISQPIDEFWVPDWSHDITL